MTDLLPCPFCGGPAVEVAFEFITCGNADLGDRCAGKDIQAETAAAWNARAPQPTQPIANYFTDRAIKIITEAAGHRDDWGKYEHAVIDLARDADAQCTFTVAQTSDGRHVAGGMQMSATEGAITQRPAHPMDTISGGPISPSGDDVLDALQWLYSVCSVEDDSKYAAVTNAARAISEALEKRSLTVAQRQMEPDWQLIETAPKDRPILLCVEGFLPSVGRWWPVDGCWSSFDWEGHFEDDKAASEYYNGGSYDPTHWALLPAGPSLTSTHRGGFDV